MMSPNDYASAFDANINIQASVHPEIPDVRVNVNVSDAGKDGYTPVKGVDYWTEEDRQAIHDYVDERVAETGGGIGEETDPTVPAWLKEVNTLDEMKDLVREIPLPDSVDVPFGKVLTVGFVDDEDGIGWVLEYPSGGGDFDDSNLQPIYDLLGSEYSTKSEIETYVAGQIATSVTNEIENTASGDVISVNDSLEASLRGLKLFGKTVQNGTPTPEAPVELISAGGNGHIGITTHGKNLFGFQNPKLNGVSVSEITDGIRITSTVTAGYAAVAYKTNIPLNSETVGQKITASAIAKAGGDNIPAIRIEVYDSTNTRVDYVTASGNGFLTTTYEIKNSYAAEGNYLQVRLYTTYSGTGGIGLYSDFTNVQLELGAVATDYDVYKEVGSIEAPTPNGLAGIPVSSGGNYTDSNGKQWVCDEIDFERGVYVQRIKKVQFDGSEGTAWSVSMSGTTIVGFYISQPDKSVEVNALLCDRYVDAPNVAMSALASNQMRTAGVKTNIFFGPQPEFTSTTSATARAEWCAFIAEHPLTLLYVLEVPVERPLSDEVLSAYAALRTNKPIATAINDSGAGMSIIYAVDVKTYIDNNTTAGEPGKDGYTPIKGKDYWTEEDQKQIVDKVSAVAVVGIEHTTSGDAIMVNDSLEAPLRDLTLFGKTMQNGTPTPDVPVALESAGDDGSIDVMLYGKNLLSLDALTDRYGNRTSLCFYKNDGLVLPAGTYTLSIGISCSAIYCRRHGTGASISYIYGGTYITFTLTNVERVWFEFFRDYSNPGPFTAGIENTAQLELGSAVTDYAEWKSQSFSVSTPNGLPGIPVATNGNYTDPNGQQWTCDEIDLKRGVYVQRVGRLVLDGTEIGGDGRGWYKSPLDGTAPGNILRFAVNKFLPENIVSGSSVVFPGFCSHFTPINANQGFTGQIIGVSITQSGMLNFYIELASASEFIAWLRAQHSAGTPVTVYYILPEPVETKLPDGYGGDYSALRTNKPVTTVTNDSGAGMLIGCIVDVKKYIDKLNTGDLDVTALNAAIETALAQAKDNGDFDGPQGVGIASVEYDPVLKPGRIARDITFVLTDGRRYTAQVFDGADGERGPKGDPGTSVGIKETEVEFEDFRKKTTIEFTDGTIISVQDGKDGKDGYTPQRGVDYWTEEDQQQIIGQISSVSAAGIENTASGDVIVVNDSLDAPLRGLKLFGKTMQNGTPALDTPVDLESVGSDGSVEVNLLGLNLVDWANPSTIKKGFTFASDGSYIQATGTGSWGSVTWELDPDIYRGATLCCSSESCSQTVEGAKVALQLAHTDSAGKNYYGGFISSPIVTTIPEDITRIYIQAICNNSGTALATENTLTVYKPLVCLVSTATAEWEEYKEKRSITISTPNGLPGIPVSSGGSYTDENGQQWVCDEIDLERGVYVQRVNVVDFVGAKGSRDEFPSGSGRYRFSFGLGNNPTFLPSRADVQNGFCSGLTVASSPTSTNSVDNTITTYRLGSIYARCDTFTTVDSFIEWAAQIGLKYAYALATPIETELPAETIAAFVALRSYRPNTTVTNDSGAGMQIGYSADTKAYIDNKFAQLAAVLAANV